MKAIEQERREKFERWKGDDGDHGGYEKKVITGRRH